ncbi:MAG: S-layer homology domain-containing protein [Candidatus Saganbacteria bacterium]|nr:S-layer homology domain-containing protein [Candidatus Saganbacteria bacterium]
MKPLQFSAIALALYLCLSLPVSAKIALDPSIVGVGARSLAQGRCYAAFSGGPDSIFLNPAALTQQPRWGLTSMYSKLINQVNYVQLGWINPLDLGTVGVGYLDASISGLQNAVRDPVTGRITFEAGLINYHNTIYYLSFGRVLLKDLSAGIHLKFYNQGYSNGVTGTGYDADLGLVYQAMPGLKIGFVQGNFIPASMGGKITWASGAEEALASTSRIGVNYSGGLYNLSADYKIYPMLADEPGLLKLGAELWLAPTLALRLGSDQETSETNFTAGLGVIFSEFEFDYAYHQYGAAENNTHVFSFSYGVGAELPAQGGQKKMLSLQSPQDESVLFRDSTEVRGTVAPSVKWVSINAQPVPLLNNSFSALVSLKLGKNLIEVSAFDDANKDLAYAKVRILKLKSFADVPNDHWAARPIAIMAMENMVSGYPDSTFRPEGGITRAEMCALLMKIRGGSGVKQPTIFDDVFKSNWASGYISGAVEAGLVNGYPDGTFKPNGKITRAEGVIIISRFAGLNDSRLLQSPYPDVPGRHWAAKAVMSAKEAGLLDYLGTTFGPNAPLTRAEVVYMLSKTPQVKPTIDRVLNFEEGY